MFPEYSKVILWYLLFFSFALRDVVFRLQQELQGAPNGSGEKLLLLIQWSVDNGYIVGAHENISKGLNILDSPATKSLGLHLKMSKCAVWWPTAPSLEVAGAYP